MIMINRQHYLSTIVNATPPRNPDDEKRRRAMFARMRGGGGGGGGGGGSGSVGGSETANQSKAYNSSAGGILSNPSTTPRSGMDFSPTRDSSARVRILQKQRDVIEATRPIAPHITTLKLVDVRSLERSLLRSDMKVDAIKVKVDEAKALNGQVRARLSAIKKAAKAKHPDKWEGYYNAMLDKIEARNSIAISKYQKELFKHALKIANIDAAIEVEKIRGEEGIARGQQLTQNAQITEARRQAREDVRRQVEEDKARRRKDRARRDVERAEVRNMKAEEKREKAEARSAKSSRKSILKYWLALSKGEIALAKIYFPTADIKKDLAVEGMSATAIRENYSAKEPSIETTP